MSLGCEGCSLVSGDQQGALPRAPLLLVGRTAAAVAAAGEAAVLTCVGGRSSLLQY